MTDQFAADKAARELAGEEGGFPTQEQAPPGLTTEMTPVPDHGEESWVGRGRLEGLKALVTGGDSGIGAAVAIGTPTQGHATPEPCRAHQRDAGDVVRRAAGPRR